MTRPSKSSALTYTAGISLSSPTITCCACCRPSITFPDASAVGFSVCSSTAVTCNSAKKLLNTDALSRCPLSKSPALASASPQHVLPIATIPYAMVGDTVNLPVLQSDDSYCGRIIERTEGFARPPNSRLRRQLKNFELVSGVLCRYSHRPAGSRWVTVLPRKLRAVILEAFKDDAQAGYLDFEKTTRLFWPGMSTSVRKYISSCVKCRHRKRTTSSPAGPLQPAPCRPSPFHTVRLICMGHFHAHQPATAGLWRRSTI